MGLNTVFTLIAVFTNPGLTELAKSDALYITMLLFRPAVIFPSESWGTNGIVLLINGSPVDFTVNFLVFIGGIVPPIVALIIAAVLAENPKDAFGVLVLTILIACGVYTLIYGIGQGIPDLYIYAQVAADNLLYGPVGSIIMIFLGGIINSFFYGAIGMYVTKAGL